MEIYIITFEEENRDGNKITCSTRRSADGAIDVLISVMRSGDKLINFHLVDTINQILYELELKIKDGSFVLEHKKID